MQIGAECCLRPHFQSSVVAPEGEEEGQRLFRGGLQEVCVVTLDKVNGQLPVIPPIAKGKRFSTTKRRSTRRRTKKKRLQRTKGEETKLHWLCSEILQNLHLDVFLILGMVG